MKNISIVIAIILIIESIGYECSHTIKKTSESALYEVTYDLSPLRSSDQWIVKDSDRVSRNFTYHFNICSDVKKLPSHNGIPNPCPNRTETAKYPAYQLSGNSQFCYNLGKGGENGFRWTTIDNDDPSVGVVYQFLGGDRSGCNGGVERSLRLSFFCMSNPSSLPNEASAIEFPQCTYNMQLESMYGCPISCGEFSNKLCGGTGVCGYDRDLKKARCFCNKGYYGSACEKEGTALADVNDTSEILFFICGFLVVVEIGVIIMWKKVKGLRLDPAAYANLNKEKMGMISV